MWKTFRVWYIVKICCNTEPIWHTHMHSFGHHLRWTHNTQTSTLETGRYKAGACSLLLPALASCLLLALLHTVTAFIGTCHRLIVPSQSRQNLTYRTNQTTILIKYIITFTPVSDTSHSIILFIPDMYVSRVQGSTVSMTDCVTPGKWRLDQLRRFW